MRATIVRLHEPETRGMFGYNLTVPEAVLIIGLFGSAVAVYKGARDAANAKASEKPAAAPALDPRFLDAILKGSESLSKIAHAIHEWREQYARDKSDEKIQGLEARIAEIVTSHDESPRRKHEGLT